MTTVHPGAVTGAGHSQAAFPTRRSLRAAERERALQTTGAAVSPPAAPVPHRTDPRAARPAQPEPELPGRRAARAARHEPEPEPELPGRRAARAAERAAARPGPVRGIAAALSGVVTEAVTVPLRVLGDAAAATRVVPVTATALAACLVVSVGSPQSAVASSPQAVTLGGPPTTSAAVAWPVALPGQQDGLPAQRYVAPGARAAAFERDAFDVGSSGRPRTGATDRSSTTPSGGRVVRPVAGTIPTAGGFGARLVAGCGACSTDHRGLDFAAPLGTRVVSVLPGRVVSAGVFGGYGNQVLVQHVDGTQTRYGHLSRIDVVEGQVVDAGQRIGAVGSTGVSTGAHLHFEVIVRGAPTDPAQWLSARGAL